MRFDFCHAALQVGDLNEQKHYLSSRRVSCCRHLGSRARCVDGVVSAKNLNFVEPQFGPRFLLSLIGKVSEW